MTIQAKYNFQQLSQLLQCHPNTIKKRLTKLHIPFQKMGREQIVYLIDLRDALPDLYYSILEADGINAVTNQQIADIKTSLYNETTK